MTEVLAFIALLALALPMFAGIDLYWTRVQPRIRARRAQRERARLDNLRTS